MHIYVALRGSTSTNSYYIFCKYRSLLNGTLSNFPWGGLISEVSVIYLRRCSTEKSLDGLNSWAYNSVNYGNKYVLFVFCFFRLTMTRNSSKAEIMDDHGPNIQTSRRQTIRIDSWLLCLWLTKRNQSKRFIRSHQCAKLRSPWQKRSPLSGAKGSGAAGRFCSHRRDLVCSVPCHCRRVMAGLIAAEWGIAMRRQRQQQQPTKGSSMCCFLPFQ